MIFEATKIVQADRSPSGSLMGSLKRRRGSHQRFQGDRQGNDLQTFDLYLWFDLFGWRRKQPELGFRGRRGFRSAEGIHRAQKRRKEKQLHRRGNPFSVRAALETRPAMAG